MNQNKPERVGILGGTFDPIHAGHLRIAAEAWERFLLDRVLFVPANISPHKRQRPVTPARHRLEMIRLAIRAQPAFDVSEIEIKRAGVSYTIDTLEAFEAQYPGAELFLILGADAFKDLSTWKEHRRLIERFNVLVATRPGHALEDPDGLVSELSGGGHAALSPSEGGSFQRPGHGQVFRYQHRRTGKRLMVFEIAPCPVSSSEIRYNIGNNKEVKNMLPPDVEQYIISHQLYTAESSPRN